MSVALLLVPIADRAVAAGDPVLVGAGDIATCNGPGAAATAALLDRIQGTVFTLGDNAYNSGTALEFARCYQPTWGRHKARTRPAPGNHDYRTPGATGYYNYFGGAAGERGKGYYSYNLGAWHIVVLNSNCAIVACHLASAQAQWLRADLAAHPSACTLAYWHHARFSSDRNHGNYGTMAPLYDLLYRAGAEVVLTGHSHTYERFAPQTAGGRLDTAFGVRQFVVGTGGNNHYPLGPALPNSQVRNASTFGVLKLTLHPNSYDWQFVPTPGATFTDSGTGQCHEKPPVPPPPPPPTVPPTTRPPVPPTSPPPGSGGGISVRGAASDGSDAPRSALTIDRPSGTTPGDVMVASVSVNDNDAFSPPPGWTPVRKDSIPDVVRQEIYYKVATASDPSSFTWRIGGNRRLAGGIVSYMGVDTTRPVDDHKATLDAGGGARLTAPSVTTSTAGGMLLALMALNSERAISPPAGMRERWERTSAFPGEPRSLTAEWSDDRLGAAGSTGSRTATASVAGSYIAAVVALRPAR